MLVAAVAGALALLVALLPLASVQAAPPVNWVKTRPGNLETGFNGIFFLPGMTEGWAVGKPHFAGINTYHCWHTSDGGGTWTPQAVGNEPVLMLAEMEGVYFRNSSLGWACGQMGVISRCTDGSGAGTWTVTRMSTPDEVLQDVFATSDNDVWAVGVKVGNVANPATYSPLVVKSDDGGLTWHDIDLVDASFADSSNGWAVGASGTVIHTADGGSSWAFQSSGSPRDLNAVCALSATEAWIGGAGGTILHTTDGGATWNADFGANAVFSRDTTHTWVGGQGGLMMFYDGTGWTRQDSGTDSNIRAVAFLSDVYGWAVGDNGLTLYTTDGGENWEVGPALAADLNDVSLFDDSGGSGDYLVRVCGQAGALHLTTDAAPGGSPAAWSAPTTPPPARDLKGIEFADATHGIVAGSSGVMAHTADGGDTWYNSGSVGSTSFTDVTYGNKDDCWVATAADGGLWLTRDGTAGIWAPVQINDVCNVGTRGTEYYACNSGTLLKRVDTEWTVMDSGTARDLHAIANAGSAGRLWAAGNTDAVMWSDDGGATWNSMVTHLGANWTDISVAETGGGRFLVTVVGPGGLINYTTMDNPPGGPISWSTATVPGGSPDLHSVSFYNEDIGWAVGEGGTVWQTLDGAQHWHVVDFHDTFSLGAGDTYLVGDGGTIVHYDAAAHTSEIQYNAGGWTNARLNAVCFTGPGEGYAVGDGGTVIQCTGGAWGIPAVVGTAVHPDLEGLALSSAGNGWAVGTDPGSTEGYYVKLAGGAWDDAVLAGTGVHPPLHAVALSDADAGYAVGDDGYVVELAGGAWGEPAQVGGANPDLNGVWLEGADVYAVGAGGYYATFESPNWTVDQVGGTNPDLYDLAFPDSEHGYAVGGAGGIGYTVPIERGVYGSPAALGTRELRGISLYDPDGRGFACGAGRTLASLDDSGWRVEAQIPAGAGDFRALGLAPGTQRGWAVGGAGLACEVNGGLWIGRESNTTRDLYSVTVPSTAVAYAGGASATALKYSGGTWSGFSLADGNDYLAADSIDDGYATLAGTRNAVWHTDNGSSWARISGVGATTDDFLSVDFADAGNGWFTGENGLFAKYEDGRLEQIDIGIHEDLNCVSMSGASDGFAAGSNRTVLHTTAPGTWDVISGLPATTESILCASFPSVTDGWFAGTSGLLLSYDDGAFVLQHPGTTEDLNGVSLAWDSGGSQYVGAAVGDNGTVVYTDDSGAHWSGAGGSLPAADINGIDVASPTKAILVGDYQSGNAGTVRLSDDGGRTWAAPATPPDMTSNRRNLYSVSFGDGTHDHAWAVGSGGAVYVTTDLGDTWVAQAAGTRQNLFSVCAYYDSGSSEYTVCGVGSTRTIVRSVDGGTTWAAQSGIPTPAALSAVSAADADNIFFSGVDIASRGMVIGTANAGATFGVTLGGVPPLNGIAAPAADAVWAAGNAGFICHFDGATWNPQDSGTSADINDVDIVADGAGYIGVLAADDGIVRFSSDAAGGDGNWEPPSANPNRNDLSSCSLGLSGPNPAVYFAGSDGTILGNAAGGYDLEFLKGPGNELKGISFCDEMHGWACGTHGTILYTDDAGATWSVQDSGVFADLNAVFALDTTHVIAVGDGGVALLWDGATWHATDVGAPYENLNGAWAADDSHVWAVGDSGAIRFWNGGSWENEDSGAEPLNGVAGTDDANVWAVGGGGTIMFFDGTSWEEQTSGTGGNIFSVSAPDSDTVFASGETGLVLRSTNGGANWSQLDTGSGSELHGIKMVSGQAGWAVGSNEVALEEAKVIYTRDGGASWTPGVSGTGIARTLNCVTAASNTATGNWDFYAAGQWGLIQKISNTDALPHITSVDPEAGTVEPQTSVTISGTGFGADQGAVEGHVIFNDGVEGVVTGWSDTEIEVTVPSGAWGWRAGLKVTTNGGASNSVPFTVTPSIAGATSLVTGGDEVVVAGEGFGPDPGAGHRADEDYNVTIGGGRVPDSAIGSWSNKEIRLILPDETDPGAEVPVRVTAGNEANQSDKFDIAVRPSITSFGSDTARPGDTVTVNGTNFGTVAPGNRCSDDNHLSMNTSDGPRRVGDGGTLEPDTWTSTSITFVVPYDFGPPSFIPRTGDVSVTAASRASNDLSLGILPRADALSESAASAGDEVEIDGACFGDAPGRVTFNGTDATGYPQWQDNKIVATVPDAAVTSGEVVVITGDGDSNGLAFGLTPKLEALSAARGRVGDRLVLTGSGFGAPQGAGKVEVGGIEWSGVTAWSRNSITVTVPRDALSGDVIVKTAGGESQAGMGYVVLPKITGLNPAKGVPGRTLVTIDGFTFGAAQGSSKVTFNGRDAGTAASWSPTRIKVTVPVGTTSGDVVVTTAAGRSNALPFDVGPYIKSVTPDHGPPNGQVTIAGDNFKAVQGSSKVWFGGVDAGVADSWSDTVIKVKVPDGARSGDVTVTTAEGVSNAVPFTVGLSNVYYFAEGTTRANFETWLCLMNPNETAANVQVIYMLGDGTTKHFETTISKTSRMTLYVADVVGLEKDVSMRVTSDVPIVAERPIYFNYGGVWTGGHNVIGAIAPAEDWYFAEGNTRDGFEEWICLQNPGAKAANVEITYMLQGGQNKVQELEVPATSRRTVSVKDFLGPNVDCSARVHADQGVIAERPMYFIYQPDVLNWTGGHNVVGANAPGREWYFAEGTTRDGFDEWLCLQNPGAAQATVTISYMLETGETPTQVVAVEPHSRKTLDVVSFIGRGRDVSMRVTSTEPIVAERPMYFDYVGLTGGHNVIGATRSAGNWFFAEGATQNGFQEWLSIQNPGGQEAVVDITFMLGTGELVEKSVTVKPHSRATVDVNSVVGWGKDVSARATTRGRVIIERPMYFNNHGWTGGHNVVGFHY